MKTTIDLPDDLVREAKLRALMQGRTLRDLVADLIRQGLGMPTPSGHEPPLRGSAVVVGQDGLPVIRCRADAPATTMSSQQLLDLEQQTSVAEDIRDAGRTV